MVTRKAHGYMARVMLPYSLPDIRYFHVAMAMTRLDPIPLSHSS